MVAYGELDGEGDEDAEGEDLEREACEGDVDGSFTAAGGGRGECTANGLEDKGEDVARDEDPVVEFWGEASVLGAEVDDAIGAGVG